MPIRYLDTNPNWFAVQVWAGREQLSAKYLRAYGYEIFLPSYHAHRHWSDRVKKIERALFEGYIFCRIDVGVAAKIVTAPGVIRLVGDRDGPLPVDETEIDAIRHIIDTGLLVNPWPSLQPGQRVRVEAGPLRGIEGVVVMVKSEHRLVVSVSLLQRSISVELVPEWVSVPHAAIVAGALAAKKPAT